MSMRQSWGKVLLGAALLLGVLAYGAWPVSIGPPPPIPSHVFARLQSDLSSTSTTLTDVTVLSVPLVANQRTWFQYLVIYRSANTAGGVHLALTGPAGVTFFGATAQLVPYAEGVMVPVTVTWSALDATAGPGLITPGVPTANTDFWFVIQGYVINGANAGSLMPRWATESGGIAATLRTGTSLTYRVE